MYGLIGFIVGCLLHWLVVEPIKTKIARKNMIYIPESRCWIPKKTDGDLE